MLKSIKEKIQRKLYNGCYEKYTREVERQKNRYGEFLKKFSGGTIPSENFSKGTGFTILHGKNGCLSKKAVYSFEKAFRENPALQMAYAHEDCINDAGKRHSPWFKPGWSPDTLESNFYFGNIVAVRDEWITGEDVFETADKIAARYWQEKGAVMLVEEILFHLYDNETDEAKVEVKKMPLLQEALRKNASSMKELVTIIIPSKDNPKVLYNCIKSVREKTDKVSYEIIVVDNGSSPENKEILEKMAKQYDFCYCYAPMEFNFSKMCNLGAKKAKGSFYLFLNDDMEIIERDWLYKLLEKAVQCHAGAVGAKLLYPDTDLIQHAGVTNLRVGPAHKLLKCHDTQIYYHGRNRYVHNMLAVTAACLLVSKEKFEKVGGFYPGIAVAYNDVDFCFSLYEAGYYNIQRNDVCLYHHESLSRGDDNMSMEKWRRLLTEKDALYQRHPKLLNKDPFYSPLLAEHFSDYICNFEYPYEKRDCYTKVWLYKRGEPLPWENNCLTVNVEHAEVEKKLDLTEETDIYWIEGWAYVLGQDNCKYQKEVYLIREDGMTFRAACLQRYREDVEDILPEQQNVALSGFVCRIQKGKLPKGSYRIALMAKDACSSQKLYQTTDMVLEVEEC